MTTQHEPFYPGEFHADGDDYYPGYDEDGLVWDLNTHSYRYADDMPLVDLPVTLMPLDETGLTPEGDVFVGPIDTVNGPTFVYRVGGYRSEATYTNSASAWHDARRPQRVNRDDRLVPIKPKGTQ